MVAQVGPFWTVEQYLLDSLTSELPLELIYEDSGL